MANDLKSCLRNILQGKVVEPKSCGSIHLREREARMTTTLVGASPEVTAIRLGKVGHLSTLPQGVPDIRKVCDYALIEDCGSRCRTTLLELKKTLQWQPSDAFEQLRRSKPIIDYLLSVCSVQLQRTWSHDLTYMLVAEKKAERLAKMETRTDIGKHRHEDIEVKVSIGKFLHL